MADLMSKKSFVDSNISMSAQTPSALTEGQKDCLRLVAQHHTSKEIARILGISPFTVDQRLDAARRKLNAPSRKDAAKMFAELDTHRISQPLVYETDALELTDIERSERMRSSWPRQTYTGAERRKSVGATFLLNVRNIALLGSLVTAVVVMVSVLVFRLIQ